MPAPSRPLSSRLRLDRPGALGLCLLHLWVLTTFAVSQPLYDLLGRNLEFLVAYDIRSFIPITALLAVGPASLPILAILACWLASRRAAQMLLIALVTALVAMIALPPLHRVLPIWLSPVLAAALGIWVGRAYLRSGVMRLFMSALTPAVVLLPVAFMTLTPVGAIFQMAEEIWPQGAAPEHAPPVVLVVFDAMPLFSLLDEHGQVDAGRLPHLSAFARQATWFRNASSVSDSTVRAVPAILTGRYPRKDALPIYEHHLQSLFTTLNGHYEMYAFESVTQICPPVLCEASAPTTTQAQRMAPMFEDLAFVYLHFLLPTEWRGSLPDVTNTWKHFGFASEPDFARGDDGSTIRSDDDPVQIFDRFLDGIGSQKQSILHFVHLDLPHPPWRYLPSGKVYRPGSATYPCCRDGKGSWLDDQSIADRALQRYLLQLGYVDRLVGRLVARLEQAGLSDEALVILTADHGENFWPGRLIRTATPSTALEVLGVPLFIKGPGFDPGAVSDRNVETIDILPTIADVLGVALPKPVDGQSLLDREVPERQLKLSFRPRGQGGLKRLELGPRLLDWEANQARMRTAFGNREGALDLYARGPHRELLKRRIDELEVFDGGSIRLEIDAHDDYQRVDLRGGFIPARLAGRLHLAGSNEGSRPEKVAIAINGVIRATVHTYGPNEEAPYFAAMIPEKSFRDGENRIDVFVVDSASQSGMRLEATHLLVPR